MKLKGINPLEQNVERIVLGVVALVFLGTQVENRVVTRELQELVGSKGQDWELLTAGAFITMTVPLIIFFALQRYFVRGMMARSVKG